MNQFLLKLFYGHKCIRLFLIYPDHRVQIKYVIPSGNTITLDEYTFILTEGDFFMYKKMPTYIFATHINKPINPLALEHTEVTPELLKIAINTHVAGDIMKTSEEKKKVDISSVLSVITLGALGVIAYLGYTFMAQLAKQIDEIRRILEILGGL